MRVSPFTKKRLLILCALALLTSTQAIAVEGVRSPFVYEDNVELEYKGKYQFDDNPARNDVKEHDFLAGYGVTDRWKTRFETEYEDQRNAGLHFKNVAWENTYSLTGNDAEWPTAIYLDLVAADTDYGRSAAIYGVTTAKNIGPTLNTLNLFARQEIGAEASNKTSLIYRFQSRYHLYEFFDPGFELWGDTNKQDDFENQSLKVGPGAYGKFAIGSAPNFGYQVLFLFGATQASSDGTLKWRLTYDFP